MDVKCGPRRRREVVRLVENDQVEQAVRDRRDAIVGVTQDLCGSDHNVVVERSLPRSGVATVIGSHHRGSLRVPRYRADLARNLQRCKLVGDLVADDASGRDDQHPRAAKDIWQQGRDERLSDPGWEHDLRVLIRGRVVRGDGVQSAALRLAKARSGEIDSLSSCALSELLLTSRPLRLA